MRKIATEFVPRLLPNVQKHRLEVFKRIETLFRMLPLPLYDFFLFPKMKVELKVQGFDTTEEFQVEIRMVLNILTKKYFHDAFQKWQKRWDRCVRSQRDYFEGDGAE
jgi:hypothetical protein